MEQGDLTGGSRRAAASGPSKFKLSGFRLLSSLFKDGLTVKVEGGNFRFCPKQGSLIARHLPLKRLGTSWKPEVGGVGKEEEAPTEGKMLLQFLSRPIVHRVKESLKSLLGDS